jgi:hypothetical protein
MSLQTVLPKRNRWRWVAAGVAAGVGSYMAFKWLFSVGLCSFQAFAHQRGKLACIAFGIPGVETFRWQEKKEEKNKKHLTVVEIVNIFR